MDGIVSKSEDLLYSLKYFDVFNLFANILKVPVLI